MISISESLTASLILSDTPLVTSVVDAPVSARATTTADAVVDATSTSSFGLLGAALSAVSAAVSCGYLELSGSALADGSAV